MDMWMLLEAFHLAGAPGLREAYVNVADAVGFTDGDVIAFGRACKVAMQAGLPPDPWLSTMKAIDGSIVIEKSEEVFVNLVEACRGWDSVDGELQVLVLAFRQSVSMGDWSTSSNLLMFTRAQETGILRDANLLNEKFGREAILCMLASTEEGFELSEAQVLLLEEAIRL